MRLFRSPECPESVSLVGLGSFQNLTKKPSRKQDGTQEQAENQKQTSFAIGGEFRAHETEHQHGKRDGSCQYGGKWTEAVKLRPGECLGVGPELGFLVVEIPTDLQIEIPEDKRQNRPGEYNRREAVKSDDPAAIHSVGAQH